MKGHFLSATRRLNRHYQSGDKSIHWTYSWTNFLRDFAYGNDYSDTTDTSGDTIQKIIRIPGLSYLIFTDKKSNNLAGFLLWEKIFKGLSKPCFIFTIEAKEMPTVFTNGTCSLYISNFGTNSSIVSSSRTNGMAYDEINMQNIRRKGDFTICAPQISSENNIEQVNTLAFHYFSSVYTQYITYGFKLEIGSPVNFACLANTANDAWSYFMFALGSLGFVTDFIETDRTLKRSNQSVFTRAMENNAENEKLTLKVSCDKINIGDYSLYHPCYQYQQPSFT